MPILTLSKQEVRACAALYVMLLTGLLIAFTFRTDPEPLTLPEYTTGSTKTDTKAALLVELNLAQPHDLLQIKGFGSKTVQSILYCRKCLGGFTDKSQLLRIPGVGKKTFNKLDSFLVISALGRHIWASLEPFQPTKTANLNTVESADLQRTCILDKAAAKRLINSRKSQNGFRDWGDVAAVKDVQWSDIEALKRHFHLIPPGFISLNTSTKADWQTLPGIGPKTAERILDYREQLGGFYRLEQLDEVRGIGPITIDKLRGRIQPNAARESLRLLNLQSDSQQILARHPYISEVQAKEIVLLRLREQLVISRLKDARIFKGEQLTRLLPYLNLPK